MGLQHFLGKKMSEHPILEAYRETPKLLNSSKNNLFSLQNNRCYWVWHGQEWEGSNLLYPPTSTLSVRGQNHSCVSSKFTFLHNLKKAISQERLVLRR